jgi:hypothetical protein
VTRHRRRRRYRRKRTRAATILRDLNAPPEPSPWVAPTVADIRTWAKLNGYDLVPLMIVHRPNKLPRFAGCLPDGTETEPGSADDVLIWEEALS